GGGRGGGEGWAGARAPAVGGGGGGGVGAPPHGGGGWARHWLDVARYADTKGYVFFQDANFPWAWTYRDYVIRAFNEDLPYDQFVMQQLAADRLPLGADRRPLTAMGFVTAGGRGVENKQDLLAVRSRGG